MAKIEIGGTSYEIPDRIPNKKRKLKNQPHTSTGACLFEFLAELFHENERRSTGIKTDPLTNEQLECVIREAFADFPQVSESIDASVGSRIAKWRWMYNKGLMTGNQPPDLCSFRYNADGRRVGKTPTDVLSDDDCRKIINKYNILDKRFTPPSKKKGK